MSHSAAHQSTLDGPAGELSTLEVAVGRMLVLGYSGSEIATRLRCDLTQVVPVVQSLRARYAAASTADAVRRAVAAQDLFRP